MFDLSGKTALITGGNSGIGLGYAKALARAGANVCIWGTNAEKNASALKELRAFGTRVYGITCDVSQQQNVVVSVEKTLSEFGRIDACFANSGVGSTEHVAFSQISAEEWNRVLGINLNGVFFVFKEVVKHMIERFETGDPGGRLIVTSSLAALSGAPRNEHYAASKGAVISMMKAIAVEHARYQITANSILPGWIKTKMTENSMNNQKIHDALMNRIPMRRWGKPEDFAGIAVYLMSDASSYHTADSFLIDGGYLTF